MRYFKNSDSGHPWQWDGRSLWTLSVYGSVEELLGKNPRVIETDAAGNPLPKYRYFRDELVSSFEWRMSADGSWKFKTTADESWGNSHQYTVAEFLKDSTTYECDESGNRLEAKGFTFPEGTKIIPCGSPEAVAADNATPSTAPMSEEERFRWQFAGQIMVGVVLKHSPERTTKDKAAALMAEMAHGAIWAAESLILALKKPKATENGGGK